MGKEERAGGGEVILLPCPWCGRKMDLVMADFATEQYVRCRGCKATGPIQHGRSQAHPGPFEHKDLPDGVEMAEKAWNTRSSFKDTGGCPFCATDTAPTAIRIGGDCYYVQCGHCGASGPNAKTREEAFVEWEKGDRS